MSEQPARSRFGLGIGSARDVLVATAVAGGIGYAVTLFAGGVLGNPGYLVFAAFWSVLYLAIGALSGVQQETTRSALPATESTERGKAVRLFAIVAGAAAAIIALTSPLWVGRVFPENGNALMWPVLVGAVGYIAICIASGILGGLASWRLVASIAVADAVLRLAAVGVALFVTRDIVILAWCVAAPFVVVGAGAAVLVGVMARRRFRLDASLGQLTWNTARTVASGVAMGALVSGFPALLTASSPGADVARMTSIIFAANILRSPLVVLTMAFQALLVQRLRDAPRPTPLVRSLLLAVMGVTTIAALLAATVGPWLTRTLFDGAYALGALDLTILVASAAPVAALVVTGAALLAAGRHGAYAAGWLVAAAGAIVALALPLTLTWTLIAALILGPLVGLAIHVVAILGAAKRSAQAPDA